MHLVFVLYVNNKDKASPVSDAVIYAGDFIFNMLRCLTLQVLNYTKLSEYFQDIKYSDSAVEVYPGLSQMSELESFGKIVKGF